MRNMRYLQQSDNSRIEPDLVLTRMGELNIRLINSLVRGLLCQGSGKNAVIIDGLLVTPDTGLTVDISMPAIAVQVMDGDDVEFIMDYNAGQNKSLTLATADGTNRRIDILEATIEKINAYADDTVYIADPVTQSVSPATRYRDKHLQLKLQVKQGTPDISPVPPATTAGTAGKITGTVVIAGTIDLSTKFYLNIAVGVDSEWVLVDCRGVTPAATTLAEIITAINSAGFGGIASNDGSDHLVITCSGTGENSIVKIKEPLDETKDAYTLILGGVETPGYSDIFTGTNGYFKFCEISVPANTVTLTPTLIRTWQETDVWEAEASLISSMLSLEGHKSAVVLDHPDESIWWKHFSDDAKTHLANAASFMKFRGAYSTLIERNAQQGYVITDPAIDENSFFCKEDGITALTLFDMEQVYPVSRKAVFRMTGADLSVGIKTALSELSTDKIPFTFPAGLNSTTHKWSRFKCHTVGSGYTNLRVIIHDSLDSELANKLVPIGDIVAGQWFYMEHLADIFIEGETYHYHIYVNDGSYVSQPFIYTNIAGDMAEAYFQCYYKPTAGLYKSADVYNIVDSSEISLIETRGVGDDIVVGGVFPDEDGTLDVLPIDFSNETFWDSWEYGTYIGVDCVNGRIKLPSGYLISDYFMEFNFNFLVRELNSKFLKMYNEDVSIEDHLKTIIYDYVVRTQDDFNNLFTRTAAGEYKIKNGVKSVYIKSGGGSSLTADSTTFSDSTTGTKSQKGVRNGAYTLAEALQDGDTAAIGMHIVMNECTHFYCAPGTQIFWDNLDGYLDFNVANFKGENIEVVGDAKIDTLDIEDGGDPGDYIVPTSRGGFYSSAFLINEAYISLINCKNIGRGFSYSFGGNYTTFLEEGYKTSKLVNCVAFANYSDDNANGGGFIALSNLLNCKTYFQGIGDTGVSVGFESCENLVNCTAEWLAHWIDTVTPQYIGAGTGFYYCTKVSNCQALHIGELANNDSSGFSDCLYLTNCISQHIGDNAANNNSRPVGFQYCDYVSNCIAEYIGGHIMNTGAVGFFICQFVSGCKANNIKGAYARGFWSCLYMSSTFVGTLTGGGSGTSKYNVCDYIDNPTYGTNHYSCV